MMDVMRMNHDYSCEGSRVDEELNINVAWVFTIKSDYRLSRADYDSIIEWAKKYFTLKKYVERELLCYKIYNGLA